MLQLQPLSSVTKVIVKKKLYTIIVNEPCERVLYKGLIMSGWDVTVCRQEQLRSS